MIFLFGVLDHGASTGLAPWERDVHVVVFAGDADVRVSAIVAPLAPRTFATPFHNL